MDHVKETNLTAEKKVDPFLIPACTEFLMTRRLKSRLELDVSHERYWFPDTVAMAGDWRKKGPVYCIPLSSLTGTKSGNLISAGRCISTTNQMWDCLLYTSSPQVQGIPHFAGVLSGQSVMTFIALALVAGAWFVMKKTRYLSLIHI